MKPRWILLPVFAMTLLVPVMLASADGVFAEAKVVPVDLPVEATEATADAAADVTADAATDAGPPLPLFDEQPFADKKTPRPKDADWKSAPLVRLGDNTIQAFINSCEVRRIEEWIRIACKRTTGGIVLLGGNRENLSFGLDPIKTDDFSNFPEGGQMIFPVRRGDQRVIEWLGVAFGYKGFQSLRSEFVLSEYWPAGDDGPTIVVPASFEPLTDL